MSSEESGSSGGGGSGVGGGKASLSALVLSAMAMMGVVAMPGKRGGHAWQAGSLGAQVCPGVRNYGRDGRE